MKLRRYALFAAILAGPLIALLASHSARAAFTWDGGDGSSLLWSTGANLTSPETAPANSLSETFAFAGTTKQPTSALAGLLRRRRALA